MKRVLLLSLLVIFSSCEKDPIQYSLSISPNPPIGGYVNPRTGTYNAGETVSILASPNQFYGFKNWSGGWNGSSPSVTITRSIFSLTLLSKILSISSLEL